MIFWYSFLSFLIFVRSNGELKCTQFSILEILKPTSGNKSAAKAKWIFACMQSEKEKEKKTKTQLITIQNERGNQRNHRGYYIVDLLSNYMSTCFRAHTVENNCTEIEIKACKEIIRKPVCFRVYVSVCLFLWLTKS